MSFATDIIITSKDGIWTDSRAFLTINDAVTAIGSSVRTLTITSPQSVTTLTIPSNITLRFERDGAINNSGQLTIQTKNIEAPNRQIFTGSGDIDFASGTILKSGWFSTFEAALSLTSDDTVTLLITKPQTISTTSVVGTNVALKWEAPGNILTISSGVTVSGIRSIESGPYQILAGSGTWTFVDGISLDSIWFSSFRSLITNIGSTKATIFIRPNTIVDYTQTTNVNTFMDFLRYNGYLTVSSGITLSIVSWISTRDVPPYSNIFTGLGTVTYTGTNLEDRLRLDLANTALGKGASLVGINDSSTKYTSTTVEGALAEASTTDEMETYVDAAGAAINQTIQDFKNLLLSSTGADNVHYGSLAVSTHIQTLYEGQSTAMIARVTYASLAAALNYDANTPGLVTSDDTPANNGTYIKLGASGTGSWQQSSYDRVALVEAKANSNTVDIENLSSVFTHSRNLFDKTTRVNGYYLDNGSPVANAAFWYSAYIRCTAGVDYHKTGAFGVEFYDVAQAYLSHSVSTNTFTAPASAVYMRVFDNIDPDTFQLELGTSATAYVAYSTQLVPSTIPDKSILATKIGFPNAKVVTSKNLFDTDSRIDGYYLDNGSPVANAAFWYSDYISCTAGVDYYKNGAFIVEFYDSSFLYLSHSVSTNTFTTPVGSAYMRVSDNSDPDVFQLEVGTSATAFEPYGPVLAYASTPSPLKGFVQTMAIQLPDDIYLITGESFSIYYNNIIKYSQLFRKGMFSIIPYIVGGSTEIGIGWPYKWEYTPTSGAETFQIRFDIINTYTNEVVATKTVNIHVADAASASNHGRTATIVTMGDSFTDFYGIADYLYAQLHDDAGGNLPIMIGQRGTAPALHDAIAGWGYYWFTAVESYGGVTNPFYNPVSHLYDFSYYMATYHPTYTPIGGVGDDHVTAFVSFMGINDIGSEAAYNSGVIAVQTIIDSVHEYDPNIKIFLHTVTPQSFDDAYMASQFQNGWSYEQHKYMQERWNEVILSKASVANKIWVVPTAAHFDSRNAIISSTVYPDKFTPTYSEVQTTDIHPTAAGAQYIADAMFQTLYSLGLE